MQSIKFEFADPEHCVMTLTTTAGVKTSYRFEHYDPGAPISAFRPVEPDGRALVAALGMGLCLDTEMVLVAVWRLALAMRDAQSSVAPDGSASLAPSGAPSSAPRVSAGIGPTPESDDGDDKDGQ